MRILNLFLQSPILKQLLLVTVNAIFFSRFILYFQSVIILDVWMNLIAINSHERHKGHHRWLYSNSVNNHKNKREIVFFRYSTWLIIDSYIFIGFILLYWNDFGCLPQFSLNTFLLQIYFFKLPSDLLFFWQINENWYQVNTSG